jgi:hypothetical protein
MISDFFGFVFGTLAAIIAWCLLVVVLGLLARINYELLALGWGLLG